MEPQALISRLFEAFPTAPVPEMTLRQAQLADQSLDRAISDDEWDKEGQKDRHIFWPDLSIDQLVECEAALAHFDEQSFVYYLPAFLRAAVQNADVDVLHPLSGIVGSTVFSVTDRSNYNLARLKRLTHQQIDCVIEFLKYISAHSRFRSQDAEKALKRYWLTPEARRPLIYVP